MTDDRSLLAALYDPLEGDRSDLLPYLDHAVGSGAGRVLDIGCGTGVFALMLADRGIEVVGVDPDLPSLDVARTKPGADRVRWNHGDATAAPPGWAADLATMTANVAQAILSETDWAATLSGAFAALRPGGELMFETRDPARRAWSEWTRAATETSVQVAGIGPVTGWVETLQVRWPLVEFVDAVRLPDGREFAYRHQLRFRDRAEVENDLSSAGFELLEVRDALDRPGREFVFLARRPG